MLIYITLTNSLLSPLQVANFGSFMLLWTFLTALKSEDELDQKLARNTAGIVFCSTPHKGSPVAVLREITALLVWPTVEVQELKES